jgi:hypothetical protein
MSTVGVAQSGVRERFVCSATSQCVGFRFTQAMTSSCALCPHLARLGALVAQHKVDCLDLREAYKRVTTRALAYTRCGYLQLALALESFCCT